jgi:gamma-glutamyl hydrolase
MRTSSLLVLLLVALCIALVSARSHRETARPKKPVAAAVKTATLNPRPIIGVFSLANSDNDGETGSIIPADYVKWLEQSGARVAVVPFNAPTSVLDQLFNSINGLLYTGGGLSLNATTPYFQQALYLFNKAKAANDIGDLFPIWGTCQGSELNEACKRKTVLLSVLWLIAILSVFVLVFSQLPTDESVGVSARQSLGCAEVWHLRL